MGNDDFLESMRYNLYNFEPSFRLYLSAVIKLSSVSIKNYLSDFRFFCGWFESRVNLNSDELTNEKDVLNLLTESRIEEYKKYLIDSNFPLKTINRRLSSLRKFGEFAIVQGWIHTNPARGVRNHGRVHRYERGEEKAMDEFESYLTDQHLPDDQIKAVTNDINEFFIITGLK